VFEGALFITETGTVVPVSVHKCLSCYKLGVVTVTVEKLSLDTIKGVVLHRRGDESGMSVVVYFDRTSGLSQAEVGVMLKSIKVHPIVLSNRLYDDLP